MAGFQKYERLLKRKRESLVEAISDSVLLQAKGDTFTKRIKSGKSSDNGVNGMSDHEMPPTSEDKKSNYLEYSKKQMKKPKIFLQPRGELSLFNTKGPNFPLTFDSIQNFLFKVLSKENKDKPLGWCQLLREKYISQVVLVTVEGIGVSEFATLNAEQEPTCEVRTSTNFETKEEMENVSNWKQKCEEEEPPTKKLKIDSTEQISDMFTTPQFLRDALPKSSSLFSIYLEITAPSQYSKDPLTELFSTNLSGSFQKKLLTQYENLDQAVENKAVMAKYGKKDRYLQMAARKQRSLIFKVKDNSGRPEDKFNRLELLLSLQEMLDHGYPLPLHGHSRGSGPDFVPLHTVVKEVTPNSPLYGVDCEMCRTCIKQLELTRISVVDEDFKIVYSAYVKPTNRITDYLTPYSGITRKDLHNVNTTIRDVQNQLRRILPQDAILVGHSLDSDLRAMKMIHPYVIDSSLIYNMSGNRSTRAGLKLLTKLFLKKVIQSAGVKGHDPAEDASASLELVLHKLQKDASYGDVIKGGDFPFDSNEKILEMKIVRQQKRKSEKDFYIPTYNSSLFNVVRFESTIIATNYTMSHFMNLADSKNDLVTTKAVLDNNWIFNAAAHFLHKKFLVCYFKMCDTYQHPKKRSFAKKEIRKFDSQLKKFRESLPENTLLLTLFTGSPDSIPLDKRSNGLLMMDLIGQQKKNFFRYKSGPGNKV